MKIILTNHARLRCWQQKVDVKELIQSQRGIPEIHGSLRWTMEDGTEVAVREENGNIVVITVISNEKKERVENSKNSRANRIHRARGTGL
jgi:predicted ribosome-associated RNA-binding protein Tma20